MRLKRWFLPETPDVLAMLCAQADLTVQGMDALKAWANGDPAAADQVRRLEREADDRKRELRAALTVAFTTPLDPEDIFELSRGLDEVLDSAKNAVREAEVMRAAPDAAIADMTTELAEGTRRIEDAFAALARRHRVGDPGRRRGSGEPASPRACLSRRHVGLGRPQ